MKNFSKVSLPWTEKEYETSEKAEKQVQMEDALAEFMQDGGSTAATPPPPPIEIEVHPSEDGILGVGFLLLIVLFLVGRIIAKEIFGESDSVKITRPTKKVTRKSTQAVEVDVLAGESPTVRKAIEDLYAQHPKACRNCHGSATEPEFWKTGQGEEECHLCYGRGRDPYDTTKKMKKDGDYKISPTYGIDPLYRGYALPGQKILAMREEEADQWEA